MRECLLGGSIGARTFAVTIVGQCRNDGTGFDVVASKPTGIHFNDAGSVHAGVVQLERTLSHRDDLSDATARIDKGCIEVDERVFHPHGDGARSGKNKEHAVIGRHIGAVHEPRSVLDRGACNFKFDDFVADFDG